MRRLVAVVWIGLLIVALDTNRSIPSVSGAREADRAVRGTIVVNQATATRTPTPISVGNFVWDDRDADGQQDSGEPGLGGITMQLWNDAKSLLYSSTTTDSLGAYTLVAPLPGDYRVRVLLPAAGDQFSPKDAAGDVNDSDVNPGDGFTDIYTFGSNLISISTIDAGIVRFLTPTPTRTPTPISIGNLIWHDLNGNGVQEAGEPGIQYVQVQLWNGDKTQLLDTTITNASGQYQVTAPLPGDYRVRVLLPPGAGVAFTIKDAPATEQTDSDIYASGLDFGFTNVFNLASNVISTTIYDAGLIGFTAFTPTPTLTITPAVTITPTVTASTPPQA